ncbi:MAG: hypothetical protein KTV68_03355, partial [Acidimicrobiia bacterium]|nr:hypothetical protein [Acidimicrobiia bacterium]
MGERRWARAGRALAVMLVWAAAGGGGSAAAESVVAPLWVGGPSSVSVAENDYGRVATYWALPLADPGEVRWSLAGSDAAHFTIDDPPGALRLRSAPVAPGLWPQAADFEAPRDADGDNVYEVTVVASAPGGAEAGLAVAVSVADADEAGEGSFSTAGPRGGEAGRARPAARSGWAPIRGAAADVYVPSAADAGEHLRVHAVYRDRHGSAKTATAAFHSVVLADLLSALSVSTSDSAAATAAAGSHAAAGGSDAGSDSAAAGADAASDSDAVALWRVQRPGFDALTLHYSVGCADSDTMTLRFAAAAEAS